MEVAQERNSTLVELEALQNDLIARLDDLDQRVCRVLKEWGAVRKTEETPSSQESVKTAEVSAEPVEVRAN